MRLKFKFSSVLLVWQQKLNSQCMGSYALKHHAAVRVLPEYGEDFGGLKQALVGINPTRHCQDITQVLTFAEPHTSFSFGNHRMVVI